MKTPVLDSRRQVMAAVSNEFPGGMDCAAARLGIKTKRLENQIYETAGCKPLSDSEIHVLEAETGTHHLPDYICALYGGVFVALPDVDALDNTDLFARSIKTDASRGIVDLMIQKALEDGEIDRKEAAEILALHKQHIAARHEEIKATIALYSPKGQVA